jgi:hypothetical protein
MADDSDVEVDPSDAFGVSSLGRTHDVDASAASSYSVAEAVKTKGAAPHVLDEVSLSLQPFICACFQYHQLSEFTSVLTLPLVFQGCLDLQQIISDHSP